MQSTVQQPRNVAGAAFGVVLIVVGGIALALRQGGIDLFETVGRDAWPLFVVVPGLVLLGAATMPTPPRGIGFAIAGSIVTTVGLLLFYQSRSGNWESWAYLWALIPLSIGAALLGYGSLTGHASMVRGGAWVGGIAVVFLVIGAWFFERVFEGRAPVVLDGAWWPILLIVFGLVVAARAITWGSASRRDGPRVGGGPQAGERPAE